jgi:putative ABC transport system substrate-binding protein
LAWLAGAALVPRALAQATGVRRIGVVFFRVPRATLVSTSPVFAPAETLRSGMRDLGWTEGRNIAFEWRSAEGNRNGISVVVKELVDAGVDLLALSGNNIVEAALRITTKVPVVMLASQVPHELGLVASLARPGGNVTGIALNSELELVGKRLELLKEAAPGIRRVAMLNDGGVSDVAPLEAQGARLGLKVLFHAVDSTSQFHDAMRNAARARVDAVSVETSYAVSPAALTEIRRAVQKYRLPMIHRFRGAVASGDALMAYAPDPLDYYRRACVFIDKILRGAKPGDLPIEVADRFYLDINLKLAESIGWKIPAAILARADRVIR